MSALTCLACHLELTTRLADLGFHVECAPETTWAAWVSADRARRRGVTPSNDVGQQQALDHAPTDWRTRFDTELERLAYDGHPFTSEDVLLVVGLPSGETGTNMNNAVGAMMTAAARRGLIMKTGRRSAAQRKSSHGAELTVWIGALRMQRMGVTAVAAWAGCRSTATTSSTDPAGAAKRAGDSAARRVSSTIASCDPRAAATTP